MTVTTAVDDQVTLEELSMKVLVALDGSEPSLIARDLVAGLPWPAGTAVHLLAAYQVPVDWSGGIGSTIDWVADAEDAMRDQLDNELRSMSEPLIARGLAVERHVARGRAAGAINDLAAQIGAELIVTGSRGQGGLRSMLLGSVATEVAAGAPCPVLVARRKSVTRLLVATDGSMTAMSIPERFERWGIFRGTRADAIAVSIPETPAFELMVGVSTLGDERLANMRRELGSQARDDADAMAERLNEIGTPATPHVRAGDPAREILGAADDHGSDLIVTGSRGIGGVERLLLGSVARNVLIHAHASVLIVRNGVATDLSRKEH
jgi:nucleotide-binding universal stress UspA family protein